MPLCRTDRFTTYLAKTVSVGNYETVNAGNYETGKDTSSWEALFTVPVHSLVPEVVL